MTWPKDVTGTKFGKLTALSDTGKSTRTHNRIWQFQCDCGELLERPISNVRVSVKRGQIPACKACRTHVGSRNMRPTQRLSIAGQVFGALTALEAVRTNNNGHVIWHFRCECGAIVERSATETVQRTKRGQYSSCGSFQCAKYKRLPDGEAAINLRVSIYRRSARARGIEFTLSREETVDLLRQNCHYCGSAPSRITNPKSRSAKFIHNGIDRIDNAKGYIQGNVVPCCARCNYAKRTMSYDEFIDWLHQAAKYQFSISR